VKRLLIVVAVLWGLLPVAGLAQAQGQAADISPDKLQVINCVENLQSDADWDQCLALMFEPCSGVEVGSEPHVACLRDQRESWRTVFDGQYLTLTEELTVVGITELATILGQWTGYVGNQCSQVAQGKPEGQADAAQYGCEISEIVGVSAELYACRAGLSTAPYCQLKE